MKIAFIDQPIGMFTVPPNNSIAIWTYEVARRLAQSGEVVVYGRRGRRQPKVERVEGVEYQRLPIARNYRYIGRLYSIAKWLARFVKQPSASGLYYLDYILQVALDLRTQGCELVHLHNFSQFAPIIRAFNPRVKIVLHMHCEWLTQLDQIMIERRLRAVDLILGCSEYITEKIRQRFPQFTNRCHALFNGVDVADFVGVNGHRAPRETGRKQLLFVGRVSPEKGLHILLDAFRLIVERYADVQLEILGSQQQLPLNLLLSLSDDRAVTDLIVFYDGRVCVNYLDHLKRQLRSLGLESRVTLTGTLPHLQLKERYHAADVLLNPSFSESFGMSLIEAMSCEVPVVATRVGGITEILNGSDAGLLVEPGDAPALAEAALRLLTNPELRRAMGQAGRRRVLERFSWEQVTTTLRDQYQHLCQPYG